MCFFSRFPMFLSPKNSLLLRRGRKREIKATSRRGKLIWREHGRLPRNFHEYSSRLLKGRNKRLSMVFLLIARNYPATFQPPLNDYAASNDRWRAFACLAATTFELIFTEKSTNESKQHNVRTFGFARLCEKLQRNDKNNNWKLLG